MGLRLGIREQLGGGLATSRLYCVDSCVDLRGAKEECLVQRLAVFIRSESFVAYRRDGIDKGTSELRHDIPQRISEGDGMSNTFPHHDVEFILQTRSKYIHVAWGGSCS